MDFLNRKQCKFKYNYILDGMEYNNAIEFMFSGEIWTDWRRPHTRYGFWVKPSRIGRILVGLGERECPWRGKRRNCTNKTRVNGNKGSNLGNQIKDKLKKLGRRVGI